MFADYCEDLAYEIAFWMQGYDEPTYPLGQLGGITRELCSNLRSLGIMVLLSHGKVDRFHHNLIRCGRVRCVFLDRIARERAIGEHDFVSSVNEPLFDAIAANDLALAHRIAQTSPSDFRPGHEYEDDYCFTQLVIRLMDVGQNQVEIAALLARMEAYLGKDDDTRLLLCRALAGADQAAFDEAFNAFLDARDKAITEDEERGQLEEPPVMAQRHVYIEGLAMLRLAGMRGFATEREYRFCPSLARQLMVEPYPED